MFESRQRPINIPQAEHQRLAGMLAQLWGNDDFQRPALPFASFVKGVWFHDRDYPPIDNYPIGGIDEADWVALKQATVNMRYADVVADLVAMFHARRLLSHGSSQERRAMLAHADAIIEVLLGRVVYPRDIFKWADRITQFCDVIAFDFCFETPTQSHREVFARHDDVEPVELHYAIEAEGRITVTPWPFAVDEKHGTIIGYDRDGYPDRLEPVLVEFTLRPGTT